MDNIPPFHLKALPLDLLIEVFSHLRQSDLVHLPLVSKTFYACSIRLLYREIHISGPSDLLKRESFWEEHNRSSRLNLTTSPRSVLVGSSSDQHWRGILPLIRFEVLLPDPHIEPTERYMGPRRPQPPLRNRRRATNLHNNPHPALFLAQAQSDLQPAHVHSTIDVQVQAPPEPQTQLQHSTNFYPHYQYLPFEHRSALELEPHQLANLYHNHPYTVAHPPVQSHHGSHSESQTQPESLVNTQQQQQFDWDIHSSFFSMYPPSGTHKDLFPDLRDRLLSFENLKRLSFKGCALPNDIYDLLSQLKGLHSFALEGCVVPSPFVREFETEEDGARALEDNHDEFALVELFIRSDMGCDMGHPRYSDLNPDPNAAAAPTTETQSTELDSHTTPTIVQSKIYPALWHLIPHSPHLHTLSVQWNKDIATWLPRSRRLINESSFPCLEHLEISTNQLDWQPHLQVTRTSLALLLSYCASTLKHLTIVGHIPDGSIPGSNEDAAMIIYHGHGLLLPELKKYTGHEAFLISSLQRSCPKLDEVVLDHPYNHINGIAAFRLLDDEFLSRLRCFEVGIDGWDMDIMYAVASKLQGLEELKINYSAQGKPHPSEAELMNFSNLLHRIPNLSVFHLYCVARAVPIIRSQDYSYGHNPTDNQNQSHNHISSHGYTSSPGSSSERKGKHGSRTRSRRRPRSHPASSSELARSMAAVWTKVVPKLREVRLMREYMVRRDEDGKRGRQWYKRDLDLISESGSGFGSAMLKNMKYSGVEEDFYEIFTDEENITGDEGDGDPYASASTSFAAAIRHHFRHHQHLGDIEDGHNADEPVPALFHLDSASNMLNGGAGAGVGPGFVEFGSGIGAGGFGGALGDNNFGISGPVNPTASPDASFSVLGLAPDAGSGQGVGDSDAAGSCTFGTGGVGGSTNSGGASITPGFVAPHTTSFLNNYNSSSPHI